jgi:hypothetical protein
MKNNLVFTMSILPLMLQSAPSYADVVYASSSLWRSPVPSVVTVTATPSMGQDFATACSDFQTLIQKYSEMLADPNVAPSLNSILNQARTEPLQSQFPSQSFQGRFKLNISADGNLITDTVKGQLAQTAEADAESDSRPHYTLAPNACYVGAQSLSAGKPLYTNDSLSQAVSAARLAPLAARLEFVAGDGVYLDVASRDTACDLASGKLSFQGQVQATVQIALDQQVQLRSYYSDLSNIGNSVVEKYHEPVQRAAALGFRLGNFFAKSSPGASDDQVDGMIVSALDAYFVEGSLELNGAWTESSDGKHELEFQSNSSPVSIGLKINR